MSRRTRRSRQFAAEPRAEAQRHWLISVAYGLGILGAIVLASSALFLAAGYFWTDDVSVGTSVPAIILWSGLVLIGAATWAWRRFVSRP